MNNQKVRPYFLLILLVATFVLVFFLFKPFLYALILAAVVALVFQPLYQRILHYVNNHQTLAALCTTLIIIIIILLPLIFLGIQIFQEAEQLYRSIKGNGGGYAIFTIPARIIDDLRNFFPAMDEFYINIDQYVARGLTWLIQNISAVFSNLAKLLVSSFIFIISLYYLLKDGHKIKRAIINLSPLTDTDDEVIFKKLETAINSVIKGNLIIAIIQGVLVGVGCIALGVPNAVLWGTVAVIAALIPGVGTTIVLIPAILFLFLRGDTLSALGLLIWGVIVVGLIDNFLRLKLIGQGTHLHPLIAFLSVFGGIIFFGPIGFLLGPLTLSLFFALLHIYLSSPLEHDLERDGF